jgi:hypothetical protein
MLDLSDLGLYIESQNRSALNHSTVRTSRLFRVQWGVYFDKMVKPAVTEDGILTTLPQRHLNTLQELRDLMGSEKVVRCYEMYYDSEPSNKFKSASKAEYDAAKKKVAQKMNIVRNVIEPKKGTAPEANMGKKTGVRPKIEVPDVSEQTAGANKRIKTQL